MPSSITEDTASKLELCGGGKLPPMMNGRRSDEEEE